MSRADRERAEFEKLILQQRADLELLCSMACAWAFEMGRSRWMWDLDKDSGKARWLTAAEIEARGLAELCAVGFPP